MATAKGSAEAFDATAAIVDGDPAATRERAEGAVDGLTVQLAEAKEAVSRAEAKVVAAQNDAAAAAKAVTAAKAEVPRLEKLLIVAEKFVASLPDEED